MITMPMPEARILIVDDQEANVLFLEDLLQEAGLKRVRAVTDSRQVLDACREFLPDLVLLDLNMPHLDGFGVLRQMQPWRGERGYLPVLVLTADATAQTRRRALDAGATDFLAKPLDTVETLLRVRNLLDTRALYVGVELRAQSSEQRYQDVLENALDLIQNVSPQGRLLYANRAWRQALGYAPEELSQLTFKDWIHPSSLGHCQALFQRLMNGEALRDIEVLFQAREGRSIPVEGNVSCFFTDEGPLYSIGIFRDVTEKKKLEQQFHRAQRMESIGVLAGGIAHDLNNILTPIVMGVELLMQPLAEPAKLSMLAMMKASADRAQDLIKQILAFACGTEGQRVPLQLKHLVRDIEKMIEHTFAKNITLRSDIPRDLALVSADSTQLYQVIMNLCVNARDAMPAGGALSLRGRNVEIDATAARRHAGAMPGPHVLLEIEDTGSGIAPEILEKIFDPFFTTKEIGKGTGLGLSTTLGIVKNHGGFLSVKSQPGAGTTFSLYLPAMAATAPKIAAAAPAQPTRGSGECILVVDDEEMVRKTAQAILVDSGYEVLQAADGVEALQALARPGGAIRAILTDMLMPHMDGQAMIAAVRRMDPKLPIIAMSGQMNKDSPEFGVGGTVAFLPKPFSPGQLLCMVREALDRHGVARS